MAIQQCSGVILYYSWRPQKIKNKYVFLFIFSFCALATCTLLQGGLQRGSQAELRLATCSQIPLSLFLPKSFLLVRNKVSRETLRSGHTCAPFQPAKSQKALFGGPRQAVSLRAEWALWRPFHGVGWWTWTLSVCKGKGERLREKEKERKIGLHLICPSSVQKEYFFPPFSHYNNGFCAPEKGPGASANGAWHGKTPGFVAPAPLQRKSSSAFVSLPLTEMKWVFSPLLIPPHPPPTTVYYSVTRPCFRAHYFTDDSFILVWEFVPARLSVCRANTAVLSVHFWNLISLIRTSPFALHLSDKKLGCPSRNFCDFSQGSLWKHVNW